MKRIVGLIPILALFALTLVSCQSGGDPASSGQARIVATVEPVRLVAAELLGPEVEIPVLLPPGVSPHAYDPLPSAVMAASEATQILAIHEDVDGWVARIGTANVWWLTPEGEDPHGWLDPLHVRNALPRLAETLCQVLPEDCPAIRERQARFTAELEEFVPAGVERLSGTRLVPSGIYLSAFSARFGVREETPIAPTEGVEPSPGDVARSIETARDAGLVVAQTGFPELAAQEVARASGARLVRIDPIGSSRPVEGYLALIDAIIGLIAP
ncbi:MAG: zinc ABC transporter substrate-binding protein [Rhodothermales bacterium]|nr:zinc ABC transporter substrate-binding protein [Rhodothermales bacterium]